MLTPEEQATLRGLVTTIQALLATQQAAADPLAVARWQSERMICEPWNGRPASFAEAYRDYVAWCAQRQLTPLTRRLFGQLAPQPRRRSHGRTLFRDWRMAP